MTAPIVETVYPANTQTGVPLGASVFIIFDQEIDPNSATRALLIEGPDSDRWTGPDMQMWDRPLTPEPDFYLDSPGYQGIVTGTLTFEKLDASNVSVGSPTYNPGVSAFKTKVIFTPTNNLAPSYSYTSHVSGDEAGSPTVHNGICSRTVGDTILGSNTGNGTAVFSGTYTGSVADSYVVQIQVGGGFGVATYNWWKTTNPINIRTGTVSENEALLDAGVYVAFGGSNFITGDTFTANAVVPEYMVTTSTWAWTTGSGSITTVPATTATSIIGDVGTPTPPAAFEVLISSPADLSTGNSTRMRQATITFSESLALTIPNNQVTVDIIPALGSSSVGTASQLDVPKILSVSGSVLTIEF
jgi:hypothetical protein